MNKTTYIIVLIFLSIIYSPRIFSQIEIGVKGGYGYGQYFFQEKVANRNIYMEFIPLYNAGLVFQYLNENKAGVQATALYTQKGWIEKTPEGGKATFLMDFTELEVLSYLKFSRKKEHGLFIKFGPFIGYSFNNSFDSSGNIDSTIINYDSLQTAHKKFDYGLAIGLSYTFRIKSTSLQIGLLFRQGMYNIIERDPAAIFQSTSQGLYANLIYTFPLSKKHKTNQEAIKPEEYP